MTDIPRLALSVRQPWAWAIIHGWKDVENRSRAAVDRGSMRAAAMPMPQGLVGFVKPQQFAEGQAQMLAEAVKEARAVMVAPSWVARMCEPESTPQPAPEPRP